MPEPHALPDRYAVIGNPIAHSKSPLIFRAFAQAAGHSLTYEILEAPVDGFAAAAAAFRTRGGRGLSVTAPFKQDAFAYATDTSAAARAAGAVNALSIDGAQCRGENFDGVGLLRDLAENLRCQISGRGVLVLGAGGAARGILLPLLGQAPARLAILNRTILTAQALAARFAAHGDVQAIGQEAIHACGGFDIVLNATSASLYGDAPPVPAAAFAPGCLAYDLSYGRGLTPFLRAAREAGARVADGTGMLVEQAAEAFRWWRGPRPDTRPVIAELTVPLV